MATEVAPAVSVFVHGLRLESEQNQREHWATKYRRKKEQQEATLFMLRVEPKAVQKRLKAAPSLRVTMTRVIGHRGREYDTDNLASSFKHVRDAVALWLGRDDGPHSGIEWVTQQVRGGSEFGVTITIEEVDT